MISIGGDLCIEDNDSLANLIALENLESIGGDLMIYDNDALVNLTGLDNINKESIFNIHISNNNLLSNCDAICLCEYLANPNGSINIYDNASGCNNPPEIAYDCGISMPCLPYGNYNFYSQDDIDSFQSDYPGCTDLKGDVNIIGGNINNLHGLDVVNTIGGKLWIFETSSILLIRFNSV